VDIPRIFSITESAHRIHNPFTPEKFATLGEALRLEPGTFVLDLGSGSGEMLCTWARDYVISGTGIDMSQLFSEQAKLRAEQLGVADRVAFIHGDAAGYVADEKVGVAACVGSRGYHRASGKEPSHRRDHPHRRAVLAAVTA
jgi:tRNA A58 N-methylase Trm61